MHTTKCQYGDREVILIHNGDWSGDCHVKVFPYDVDNPYRHTTGDTKPIVEFTIEGAHMVRVALRIVGPKLMSAAERFIDKFFDEQRRFDAVTLLDLVMKG